MLYARSVALARNLVIPAKIPHFSSNKVKFRRKNYEPKVLNETLEIIGVIEIGL